nr:uncharacterized protein LOC114924525 [Arachis hypogaea]
MTAPIRRWQKENFGDLDKKILKFEEEIKKIDDMVGEGAYDGTLEARRKALVSCCEKWYVRKELHWKQMSRSRHTKDIDKNTRYFHNLASARRRNNRIDALLINGRMVRNQARIKIAIRDFYKNLDHQEATPLVGFRNGLVEMIGEDDALALEVQPTPEEIKEAVWDCESRKAPGSDGYNMNFIKRCWAEIGSDFTEAVMNFFLTCKLPADANLTWVALAPKFPGATEIKDLRPISMSAFVKGRKIHDGALIACETVQWMKATKKEGVIIKLDFQKAYDKVRWNFVDLVLQKMGFGQRWRNWIRECVSTSSMSVLINGSPSKPFKMERGLRQGDPLSSFLFVLVAEVMHRMFREAVRNGRLSPLLVGRDHVELSHLQFADDTVLFCPPEEETIKNYKRILRCFELMSGLTINFDKSSMIPVNCDGQWILRMSRVLGCKVASLPVKYLGIQLGANPRLVKTWKPIIDKVEQKLSVWKSKTLSRAGKLVLIKSVLNSLPVYYLSLYKMPKAVAEKLISLQRRFLWSKEDGRLGMTMVRWKVVQTPKKFGGLGVGDAMVRNTTLLFKWWWRFSKEDCPLWKKVVCSCNNLNPNVMLSSQVLPTRGGMEGYMPVTV